MSAIVEFREASYRIGTREILRRLTLAIEPGETLVLLGRSGSGKTTALKMVNGLLLPSGGEVLVDGTSTTAWDPVRLKRRIGYVIQEIGLFPLVLVGYTLVSYYTDLWMFKRRQRKKAQEMSR